MTLKDAISLPAFSQLLERRLSNFPLRRILIRDNGWGNGALKWPWAVRACRKLSRIAQSVAYIGRWALDEPPSGP